MLHHIKKLFGFGPKEAPVIEVPYKVEAPVVKANSNVAEQATQAVVESIVPAKNMTYKPAAKKAPAAKKPAAKKPRTPKVQK